MSRYDSSFSPLIKVTRFLLYTLLLISSIGLILSSLRIGTVRGVPKYHPGKVITLAAPNTAARATYAVHHGHHHDKHPVTSDLTSLIFPRPTTTAHATKTHKKDKHHHKTHTDTATPHPTSTHHHGHESTSKAPRISVSSFPAPVPSPHPDPFPAPGGYYTYCKTNKAVLTFIAIAGLVSSILVLHLLFIFPNLRGIFVSHFWFEMVVIEVLFLVHTVVAVLSIHQSQVLRECTRDAWRKPALLAFAWSGMVLCLLATLGLILVALLEKSRGNDHVWRTRINDYTFGEEGAVRLEEGEERAPLVGH